MSLVHRECPLCAQSKRQGFIEGQEAVLKLAIRQAELSTQPVEIHIDHLAEQARLQARVEMLEGALGEVKATCHLRPSYLSEEQVRRLGEIANAALPASATSEGEGHGTV